MQIIWILRFFFFVENHENYIKINSLNFFSEPTIVVSKDWDCMLHQNKDLHAFSSASHGLHSSKALLLNNLRILNNPCEIFLVIPVEYHGKEMLGSFLIVWPPDTLQRSLVSLIKSWKLRCKSSAVLVSNNHPTLIKGYITFVFNRNSIVTSVKNLMLHRYKV